MIGLAGNGCERAGVTAGGADGAPDRLGQEALRAEKNKREREGGRENCAAIQASSTHAKSAHSNNMLPGTNDRPYE
jgi:hypothetical protein